MTDTDAELVERLRAALRKEQDATREKNQARDSYDSAADRAADAEDAVIQARMDLLKSISDSVQPHPGSGPLDYRHALR